MEQILPWINADDIALLTNTPAQAETLLHSLEWAAAGIWTPSHGQAKAGRPIRTYIQQLYSETGFSLGRLRDIHADGVTMMILISFQLADLEMANWTGMIMIIYSFLLNMGQGLYLWLYPLFLIPSNV